MTRCECTLAQRMVGDGCSVCNPAKALECQEETIADLRAHRDMLTAELERLRDALKPTYSMSPEGRAELDRIDQALKHDAKIIATHGMHGGTK